MTKAEYRGLRKARKKAVYRTKPKTHRNIHKMRKSRENAYFERYYYGF